MDAEKLKIENSNKKDKLNKIKSTLSKLQSIVSEIKALKVPQVKSNCDKVAVVNISVDEFINTNSHQQIEDGRVNCIDGKACENNTKMQKENTYPPDLNAEIRGGILCAGSINAQTSHQSILNGRRDFKTSDMTLINYLRYLPDGNYEYDMWDSNLDLDVSSVNVESDTTSDSTIKQCNMAADYVTFGTTNDESDTVNTIEWNEYISKNLQKTPKNVTWTQEVLNELNWPWPPHQNDHIISFSPTTSAMGITTVNQVEQEQIPQVSMDAISKTTRTINDVQIMHNASPWTLATTINNLKTFQEETTIDCGENVSDNLVAINEQPVMTGAPEERKESVEEAQNVKLHVPLSIRPKNKTGCDITKMIVKASDKKAKKLCCPYCDKLYSKLARHIESKHSTEPDVQRISSFEKGSKERRVIQDLLRKTGTFNWNMNAELNNGEFMTSRRPNIKLNKKAKDYKPCPYCLGGYANLRHHVSKNCPQKPLVNKQFKGERVITVLSKAVEARYSEKANKGLRQMFESMQEDDILRLIKFDWLLIEFGNRICLKYNAQKDQGNKSNQLRTAGRLLSTMKSINSEVRDFASIYQTELFDEVIDAIKIMNEFDPITNEFKTPGPASTCVALIKRIGKILESQYIRKKDPVKRIETKDFLDLTLTDMPYVITKAITDTKSRMRRERIENLPSSDDVQRLAQYINVERNAVFQELKKKFSYDNWVKLSQLTLASILVFNRRRVGETHQIKESDFTNRESFDENSNGQLFAALSEESKRVAKQYKRMKVRGKKDRTVPVLLDRNVEECITVLLDNRRNAGVTSNNKWLFALPSSRKNNSRFVNGWTVLSTLRKSCGAVNPSSLTGTNLRKHMATFCVTLELNDGLVSEVADFMGHANEVHRGYYRNNTVNRQVVTMSKMLEAAQGNTADNQTKNHEGPASPMGVIQSHARKIVQKRKIKSHSSSDCESKPVPKRKKQSENEKGPSQPKSRKIVSKRNIKSQPFNECESKPAGKRKKQSASKGSNDGAGTSMKRTKRAVS